jgi:Protein of unknown function (DUF3987)
MSDIPYWKRKLLQDLDEDEIDLLDELGIGDFPDDPEPRAFGGTAGEIVDEIAQHTSASRVGLLASVLSIAGAVLATSVEHHGQQVSSLNVTLVGESGSKKSTAMTAAWDALTHPNAFGPQWDIRLTGIGSGEGIVFHGVAQAEKNPSGFARMLLMTGELSELLVVGKREGSTLTQKLRNAFDREPLMNVTRAGSLGVSPAQYQLGTLAAITPDELRSLVAKGISMTDGYLNRALWVPVQERPNVTVDGATTVLSKYVAKRLHDALEAAEMDRTSPYRLDYEAADELTRYYRHVQQATGIEGTLARRLATHALRVALVHASIELHDEITPYDVWRGIALTEYTRHGLRWVFGESIVASRDAIRVLRAVHTAGRELSMREMGRAAWGGRYSKERLQDAIDELRRADLLVIRRSEPGSGGGRPAEKGSVRPSVRGFSPEADEIQGGDLNSDVSVHHGDMEVVSTLLGDNEGRQVE